ncbi:hypothetical protein [Sneathiella aquimaris]|uniref:hypothetical protein n=1 Tax=Sneathiella aquimaris TaxID=2599305 RepID=UPI00146BD39B|nr:hypothetical protein [Sneathiella aquimaris]
MARNYISKLPLKSTQEKPVWVEQLTSSNYIDWWHQNIQPSISTQTERADHDWNWKRLYFMRRAYPQKDPQYFALCTQGINGTVVLSLCLCLCDERFPVGDQEKALFVWYLSGAPKEALTPFIEEKQLPGLIGRGSLDTTLVKSLKKGHNGCVWLHADGRGGKKLINTYISWGMKQIPSEVKILRFGADRNDGRYLYFDQTQSEVALTTFDIYRES